MYSDGEIAIFEALQIDWDEDDIALDRRSPQTVERYRYQAVCLMRRAGTTEVPGTIEDAIDLLVAISPTLRHSTCRQYRAALLQTFRDHYDAGVLDWPNIGAHLRRLGLLRAAYLEHGEGNLLPVRCGAGRRRGLLPEPHRETVFCLRRLGTRTASTLSNLLVVGDMVGLRPSEWPNASVHEGSLLIPSAKVSNRMGRGLIAVRSLDLMPLGRSWIETITSICSDIQRQVERYGSSEKVMERYAALLRAHRTDDRMTLRSMRHQFRKNAKCAGWSSAQIAVAMNHATIDSQRAYGRDARGRKGLRMPGIDQSLVACARPGRPDPVARRSIEEGYDFASLSTPRQ